MRLAWEIPAEDSGIVDFRWVETGGPQVTRPTRRGFGSRLVERGLPNELRGEVKLDFAPDGLICTIRGRVRLAAEDAEG